VTLCSFVIARTGWRGCTSRSAGQGEGRRENRSWIAEVAERRVDQERALPPADLIARHAGAEGRLAPGTLLFGGTLGAIGGVRPAARFEMELSDPVLGRSIRHAYTVIALPVVA
jgi:hypothetical protein